MAARNSKKLTLAASAVFDHEDGEGRHTRGLPFGARRARGRPKAANVTNISDKAGQADYWNRAGALRWIDNLDILDRLLRPVSTRLMAAARAEAGERVIDVGCGCGAPMALRWTAAAMQEAAQGFRRLKAYKQLPFLRAALAAHQSKHALDVELEPNVLAA